MKLMTRTQPAERIVPAFRSVQEAAEFWDAHSTTEFEEHWQPVNAEVELPLERAYLVSVELDETAFSQLRTAAKGLGISTDELANRWLRERLASASDSKAAG
jgi:hypothetical protein